MKELFNSTFACLEPPYWAVHVPSFAVKDGDVRIDKESYEQTKYAPEADHC